MLPSFVLDQLSRPHGRLAPVTALVLNGINLRTILAGVAALDLALGQRVVEIGFGGGLSLPLMLRAVGEHGQVFAIEASHDMLARARRRYIIPRLQGRLRLEHARIEQLPLGDEMFDAALSLNTITFWTDVDAGMRELSRVLAPGGRLVLGIAAPDEVLAGGFAARGFRVVHPDRLVELLPRYGLEHVEQRRTPDGTHLLIARRNDESFDGL